MKNLTIKIALGVFIGVTAALIVFHIPGWMQQREQEDAARREEATAALALAQKTHAEQTVRYLTPDVVTLRCGKPTYDKPDKTDYFGERFWDIGYRVDSQEGYVSALFRFEKYKNDPWTVHGVGIAANTPMDETAPDGADPIALLRVMPCLDK